MGTTDEERSRHKARVLDRGGLERGVGIECDACGLIIAATVTSEEAEATHGFTRSSSRSWSRDGGCELRDGAVSLGIEPPVAVAFQS